MRCGKSYINTNSMTNHERSTARKQIIASSTAESGHIKKSISSTMAIRARPEIIWENITNVKLDQI